MSYAAATSDPRATAAAMEVIAGGGTAVDAAVTAALLLFVIEPQSCGVGGDAFLIHADGESAPVALDGAGAIPAALTQAALEADGFDAVPPAGARSVTVPGAVSLLEAALARFGTVDLEQAAQPAIRAARAGFEVRPHLAEAAARSVAQIADDPVLGPLYVPRGDPVAAGATIANPDLAVCLDRISRAGAAALYHGDLGADLVATVAAGGGYLTAADLSAHRTEEITTETVELLGRAVHELPLPTQGPVVLRTIEALDVSDTAPIDWVAVLAALRRAMRDTGFDPEAIRLSQPRSTQGDTTYLAVIDRDGRTASLITSIFGAFGSHLGVRALGGPVHNRATTLRMVGRPPQPGKPPHTIIPALVEHDGRVEYALGVAGGLMQPQAQVQVLLRMLIEGTSPQAAIDAPRFKICFGGDVALEAEHPLGSVMAEALERPPGPEGFGACQVAGWHRGVLSAGADQRRGGRAAVATR